MSDHSMQLNGPDFELAEKKSVSDAGTDQLSSSDGISAKSKILK